MNRRSYTFNGYHMLKEGNESFSIHVVALYSEALSAVWQWCPFLEKAKTIYMDSGHYFAVFDLEGTKTEGILGRSSGSAEPPHRRRLLSRKPRPARGARARLNCRRRAARLGAGSPCPQQEAFTDPAGPGARSGISRTSRQCVLPESSEVIKLSCPDEKPGRPRLQCRGLAPGCLRVFTTRVWLQKQDNVPIDSGRHGNANLPEAGMYEEYF